MSDKAQEQPLLEVTACYFPGKGEVDLTWEDKETHERAALTAKVTPEEGKAIARTVCACVFHDAKAVAPADLVAANEHISFLEEQVRSLQIANDGLNQDNRMLADELEDLRCAIANKQLGAKQ